MFPGRRKKIRKSQMVALEVRRSVGQCELLRGCRVGDAVLQRLPLEQLQMIPMSCLLTQPSLMGTGLS